MRRHSLHRGARSSEPACDECTDESDRARGEWHQDRAWSGSCAILRAEKISNGHPLLYRFQFRNKLAETLGENSAPPRQIKLNARAGDIMMQQLTPSFPQLSVEQAVNIMVMNRLHRLEKLMSRMEEPRLIFPGQCIEIFKPDPPESRQFRVLHEGLRHIA